MTHPNDTFRYASRGAAIEAAEMAGLDLDDLVVKQLGGVWGWLVEGADDAPPSPPQNPAQTAPEPSPGVVVRLPPVNRPAPSPAPSVSATMDPSRQPEPGDLVLQYLGPQPAMGAILMAEEMAKQHEGFFVLKNAITGEVVKIVQGKKPRNSSGLTAEQHAKMIEMCCDDGGTTARRLDQELGVKKTGPQWVKILTACADYEFDGSTAIQENGRPTQVYILRRKAELEEKAA
jgi:hypothetical protein